MAAPPLAGAVLVAAGASTRMGGVEKLWAPLAGRPLLAWALDPFARCTALAEVVLVVRPEDLEAARALIQREGWEQRVRSIVPGGPRRRDSVRLGLEALSPACALAVISDGARPLVPDAVIRQGLALVPPGGGAVACLPVKETIKRVEAGRVVETVPRAHLLRAEAPQTFARAPLLAAHHTLDPQADPPDDAALALACGLPLVTYPGSHEALLVTVPADLAVLASLLR